MVKLGAPKTKTKVKEKRGGNAALSEIANNLRNLRPLSLKELFKNRQAFTIDASQRATLSRAAGALGLKFTTRKLEEDDDKLVVLCISEG